MTVTLPEVAPVESPAEPLYPELVKMADLLREGWAQGDYCVFDVETDEIVGYCALGAMVVVTFGGIPDADMDDDVFGGAAHEFALRLGFDDGEKLVDWNDAEGRTADEVIERVERAAYGL